MKVQPLLALPFFFPFLMGCATVAHAQTMKPGLWEVSSKMQGGMGSQMAAMQEQLEKMPPQQRKMMQIGRAHV